MPAKRCRGAPRPPQAAGGLEAPGGGAGGGRLRPPDGQAGRKPRPPSGGSQCEQEAQEEPPRALNTCDRSRPRGPPSPRGPCLRPFLSLSHTMQLLILPKRPHEGPRCPRSRRRCPELGPRAERVAFAGFFSGKLLKAEYILSRLISNSGATGEPAPHPAGAPAHHGRPVTQNHRAPDVPRTGTGLPPADGVALAKLLTLGLHFL